MYITHTRAGALVPIGSQYKLLYYKYERGWEMLLLQCIRAKLGCPRAIIRIRAHIIIY